MSLRVLPALGVLACALCLVAPQARAQVPASGDDAASVNARARYNAGTRSFADRRFVEAALNFEAAASEKPSPVALYTAALSWEQANVPDRAADDYARSLSVAGLPADKVGLAKERLASLEAVFGAVTVTGPDGTRAQLDANTELPVPATLHGAAGVHTLSTRAPGKPIERRPVVLERGKTLDLDLATAPPALPSEPPKKEDVPAPPSAPPPPPPAPSVGWRKPVGFTAAGVGGAFLLSGVVLGCEAIGARDVYRGNPTQGSYDHASELQTWTNVAFIAGAVLAAGGIALVVWPSPRPPPERPAAPEAIRVTPGPGGLLVQGAF
jgi:hypothetical protein